MKKITLFLFTLSIYSIVFAQTEIDALRFAQQDILGSAKFSAMSGAYGALGADFSALSYNPAGLGLYQYSELSFTPNFSNTIATSYYSGNRAEDEHYKMGISNFGYVISSPKNDMQWKRINMAFGYNRLTNFSQRIYIIGENNASSLIDNFVANAQGNTINQLNEFADLLAWNTYLFDPKNNQDDGQYISNLNSSQNKTQEEMTKRIGSLGEYICALGTSFEERIYLGLTIGFPSIDFYEQSIYSEKQFADTAAHLDYFDFEEEYTTTGNGMNLKAGFIARVNDWIKIGGALHSPTVYEMHDEYASSLIVHWNDTLGTIKDDSPLGYFDYELRTPWKAIGSMAINLHKKGQISADIEIIDYSASKYNAHDYKFTEENNLIHTTFTKTYNMRVGGEWLLNPIKIRAGYALYGSPYKNNPDLEQSSYSFGMGIDKGSLVLDIAYILSEGQNQHNLYSADLVSPTNIITTNHNLLFTLGIRY